MVLELKQAQQASSERDLPPTEAPSQYFQLCPTGGSQPPVLSGLVALERWARGGGGGGWAAIKGPIKLSWSFHPLPPLPLLFGYRRNLQGEFLSLSPPPFLSWLLYI